VSHLLPPEDVIAAYVDLRVRMITFLRELPEEIANTTVPHCPSWTVQETVSHMVGVPDALLMGDFEGIASDEWTQRQVDRHRGVVAFSTGRQVGGTSRRVPSHASSDSATFTVADGF
jgi:hypothetical protein